MIFFMNPNIISIISGIVITVLGESIRIWAVSYAGSETRTTVSVGGSNLITQGPFNYIRNPLYLGNIIIYSGIGLMSYAGISSYPFPCLQLMTLVYFSFQYYFIIINEEQYLKTTFKENYLLYEDKVNRFIPKKIDLPEKIKSQIEFSFKNGIKSEKRSLQSIIIITFIILIYYFYKF